MAEAWAYEKRGDMGVVIDENGLPVCMRVSEEDGSIIASAPLLAERVRILQEALSGVLDSSEDGGDMNDIDWSGIRAALEATKEES